MRVGVTSDDMDDFLEVISGLESEQILWKHFTDYIKIQGFDLIVYRHLTPIHSPDHLERPIYFEGMPSEWLERYDREGYKDIDPIFHHARHSLTPFRWTDVPKMFALNDRQEEYLRQVSEAVPGDGYCVIAFGPSQRNGYFSIGCSQGVDHFSRMDCIHMYWACKVFHTEFSRVRLKMLPQDFELTSRETKILKWLAVGNSEAMICGLVSARLESIHYAIESIMKKMGVTDRPSAILRGIGCGIIETHTTSQKA